MYNPTTKSHKSSNHELLVEIDIKISNINNQLGLLLDKVNSIQGEVIELNKRIPIRKQGWFRDYWELVEEEN
jgi:CBS domain containing-hemolysin-like protein